jgi:hypothetical protein
MFNSVKSVVEFSDWAAIMEEIKKLLLPLFPRCNLKEYLESTADSDIASGGKESALTDTGRTSSGNLTANGLVTSELLPRSIVTAHVSAIGRRKRFSETLTPQVGETQLPDDSNAAHQLVHFAMRTSIMTNKTPLDVVAKVARDVDLEFSNSAEEIKSNSTTCLVAQFLPSETISVSHEMWSTAELIDQVDQKFILCRAGNWLYVHRTLTWILLRCKPPILTQTCLLQCYRRPTCRP